MQTFNFKVPLTNIDGSINKTEMICNTLATVIGQQTEGKTLKLYGWLRLLQIGEPLVLDDSDKNDLIKLVESDTNLYLFAKGQILAILTV